ncbi:hypothetical protein ABFS82_14G279800 [Erythranthe guttata]
MLRWITMGLDTEKGKKAENYWILKNSWGIEGGYMCLPRNSGRPEGICCVNLFAVYPIKRTDNPPPFQDKLIRNNSRFKLSAATPYAFRRRSLKAAVQPNKVLELLSLFIIELSIVEHGMNKC